MLMTHNSEVTCESLYYRPFLLDSFEPIHVLVHKEKKTTVIMLKILGSTVQNLAEPPLLFTAQRKCT